MRGFKGAVAGVLFTVGIMAASPASACMRTLVVKFDEGAASVADSGSVASFVAVPTYGSRQRIIVRVAAQDHDLARRRAATLSDLLQANGLHPAGIMIETETREQERAVILIFPGPTVRPDPRLAQNAQPPAGSTPPRRSCGG